MLTMEQKIAFIRRIYPAAKKVSESTGIAVEFVLAQAALETGWGERILPGTNNLFNIKAGPSWNGPVKDFDVPEYKNGKLVYENSKFRVYNSYEESIYDWLNFLQTNPRYSKLFDSDIKSDPYKLAYEIQKAGYATDPNYAQKLIATMNGSTIKKALNDVSNSNNSFYSENPHTYVVKPGDTLSKIAKRYRVPLDELIKANPWIKDPNLIYPGQKIKIPGYAEKARSNLREATRRIDPLVIDLDGDGIELTDIKDSTAMFDISGSGFANKVGWVSSDDGFLVLDKNSDNKINDISEMFGNANQSGFAMLSLYDTNRDGKIDAFDDVFKNLKVWQDRNADGRTDEGELKNLEELGIKCKNFS